MEWPALDAVLATGGDADMLRRAIAAVEPLADELPGVDMASARERLERLERAEAYRRATETLLAEAAGAEASPMGGETSLVRGEALAQGHSAASTLVHETTSFCSICREDFSGALRERCVAVLPCQHAICAACLTAHREHARRPASAEFDPGFISDESQFEVPATPQTSFTCTTCRQPIADGVVEELAAALVGQESFLRELASFMPHDGAEHARRLIVAHCFDVPAVEAALFDLAVAASALGMDHARRQALYDEARAPVRALRAELAAAETAAARRELRERLRHATSDAGRHLFANMNSQSTMGAEVLDEGLVEVDFHGLHLSEAPSAFAEFVAPVVPAMEKGVRVVTGAGAHSRTRGYSELREEVRRLAVIHGFQASLTAGGVVIAGADALLAEHEKPPVPAERRREAEVAFGRVAEGARRAAYMRRSLDAKATLVINRLAREAKEPREIIKSSTRATSSMDSVKLIASDGSEFIVDRRAILVSSRFRSLLGQGQQGEIKLQYEPRTLEHILKHLYFKLKYPDRKEREDEYKKRFSTFSKEAVELAWAAGFLDSDDDPRAQDYTVSGEAYEAAAPAIWARGHLLAARHSS